MITITNFPAQIETNEDFVLEGTVSDDLKGKAISVIVDNQFKSSGGQVSDDGSWSVNFVFLSSGNRRLTIGIENESETIAIEVIVKAARIQVEVPTGVVTQKAFVLKGTAENFEEEEELIILVDDKFEVARPHIKNGKWEATLTFNQGGNRRVEVFASDQERTQITISVSTGNLTVISRSTWRAKSATTTLPNLNPRRITVHHTVMPTLSSSAAQADEETRMRDIQNGHFNRGFSDIGYHFVIMPSGRIYEGRPNSKRGSHDVINDGFGVAFDGKFHLPGSQITDAQFNSAVALCTQLCKRMNITDPTTKVSTPTALAGRPSKNLPRIIGHRDRFASECPGSHEGKTVRLGEILQKVKAALP